MKTQHSIRGSHSNGCATDPAKEGFEPRGYCHDPASGVNRLAGRWGCCSADR
ncbi:uncharacterized protein B0I36DRAFT_81743 [Microdochium trichocladiopsis]|uniref:Uncharacterized protein n=1 Tax=Microdochium trichocladiopsis TaxID=1682393 RepID=A0A9P8YAW4_9PEZI|nr:uncharacterized protein B0I36DRAFT_81743 [Microdochium trichocladiopsis]KAH7034505.1 hypothetical protein B0I36DRAFT_81743 [Microdochium trichocladiopsis]